MPNTADDRTGTRALSELLTLTRRAVGRIADLPADCEAKIWWSADSDSPQGGFVLPIELAAAIAELGVDVHATVYLVERAELAAKSEPR